MSSTGQLFEQYLQLHLFMDDSVNSCPFLVAELLVLLLDDQLRGIESVVGHLLSIVLLEHASCNKHV